MARSWLFWSFGGVLVWLLVRIIGALRRQRVRC